MAMDGALVALQPPTEVIVASARVPEDPLQRLHETMAQTPEGAQLRAILQESSPFVRNTISQALLGEMAASYQNVVAQLEALLAIKEEVQQVLDSEEAVALGHLMRNIHPSNIQGLERDANGINDDIRALRSSLEQGNMEALQKRAKKIATKARRFRDKFADIRPLLDKLKMRMEVIGERCKKEAEKSDGFIAQVQEREAWWSWVWTVVSGTLLAGGGGVLMILPTIGLTITALAASWWLTAPIVSTAAVLLALACLGFAGRGLVKQLLAKIWKAEVERHKSTKAAFQCIELGVRAAAEKLQRLQSVSEKKEALELCLDLVVGEATELADAAEDAEEDGSEADKAGLYQQIQRLSGLSGLFEEVPMAFEQFSESLRDLQHKAKQGVALPSGPEDLNDATPAKGSILDLETCDAEVDDGWILVQSPSLASLGLPPSVRDCLPPNTYILVPVAEAARLGALFAAGPNGNHVTQVHPQGQGQRLLRRFYVGGSVHDLTADHPLAVMRSGEWTLAETRTLCTGDEVKTSGGVQAVQDTEPPRGIRGEVFSLEVSKGEEIYVFTREDGDVSLSGVAVLGSPDPERMQRSSSAPPRFRSDVPSVGSLKCKTASSCTNVCRKFMRGKCEEGRSCRFCHLPHPQEPKRQPRGPREGKSSSSQSTIESMD